MQTIDVVNRIDWFSNVGTPMQGPLGEVIPISNWDEAIAKCSDPTWEDVCTEARNELTMHLNDVCKSEFQKWNDVINQIKQDLAGSWNRLDDYLEQQNLPSIVAECTRWDTMHAVASEQYLHHSPPQFFVRLLSQYQAGRFPCGWSGAWPKGKVFVY